MAQPPVIVGIGEVLWDIFSDYQRPGGAPANVVYHASMLGNKGIIASRLGRDEPGRELKAFLTGKQINVDYLQTSSGYPTGTVEVKMVNDEASYQIKSPVAWDELEFDESWYQLSQKADAVCFGTLAQRSGVSRNSILQFLDAVPSGCLKILDLNLREPFYDREVIQNSIRRADVIKLNENEYSLLGDMFNTDDVRHWLFENYEISIICLTKGSSGSELITQKSHFIEPRYNIDTGKGDSVGVGDAFTAALTHQMLRQRPLDQVLNAANRYAAHIAAKIGAMPDVPELVIRSILND